MNANEKKLKFGMSAVAENRRVVERNPQLIALSTKGGFKITPAISSALNIATGDYVQFVNNLDEIDRAIMNNDADLVAYCEQAGLDITSSAARIAIHKEFGMWGLIKGVPKFDSKGNRIMGNERLSIKDKTANVEAHFDEYMETVMNQDENEEIKETLTRDGITHEEQVTILTEFVQPKQVGKFTGSKTSNVSNAIGVGNTLLFTDTNVWFQLKADLGDEATDFNRVFDIDLSNIQTIEVSNGYEMIEVPALILGESVDKTPSSPAAKKANVEE